MVKCEIVNVVATASINEEVNLEKISHLREITHDPSVYHGRVAYFKNEGMQGKVSIFSSGKLISVGTKSEQNAFNELDYTAQFLSERGFIKSVKLRPEIRNIVATANLELNISLERLAEYPKVIYEPEQFPGAIIHLKQPHKASVLVFASGKLVIAGLTSSTQIKPTILQIEKMVESTK